MARPCKLTPQVQETIFNCIRNRMPYADACRAAGINPATAQAWRRRGEKAKTGKYREFVEGFKRAREEGLQEMLEHVKKYAEKNIENVRITTKKDKDGNVISITEVRKKSPRWALELMARWAPERYGKRVMKHEHENAPEYTPPVLNIEFGTEDEKFDHDADSDE